MNINFLNNDNIDVYVNVKWLIRNCIKENSPHIFVKYMAIEDYYGKMIVVLIIIILFKKSVYQK